MKKGGDAIVMTHLGRESQGARRKTTYKEMHLRKDKLWKILLYYGGIIISKNQ